jgi:hypothetical protein
MEAEDNGVVNLPDADSDFDPRGWDGDY